MNVHEVAVGPAAVKCADRCREMAGVDWSAWAKENRFPGGYRPEISARAKPLPTRRKPSHLRGADHPHGKGCAHSLIPEALKPVLLGENAASVFLVS